MSRLILSNRFVGLVFFIERWVFSVLFLFLAWEHLDILRLMVLISQSKAVLPGALLAHDGNFSNGVTFDDYARYILLTLSFGACGVLLLISRRPKYGPTRAVEVLLPFAVTFAPLAFDHHLSLPAWMVTPLIPDDWKPAVASGGIALSLGGLALSIYAILWLGRSMGIVVSVREVVLGGPYRRVRHPIYLGYVFVLLGMFLTAYTPRMAIVVLGAVAVLIWRARLEERFLRAHSPAYREQMRHTGFLWPRRTDGQPRLKAQENGVQVPSSLPSALSLGP